MNNLSENIIAFIKKYIPRFNLIHLKNKFSTYSYLLFSKLLIFSRQSYKQLSSPAFYKPILKLIISVFNKNFYLTILRSFKNFVETIEKPDPVKIWKNYIKTFLFNNKIAILGTLAVHMIGIIIFLSIKLYTESPPQDTGLFFDFTTEELEFLQKIMDTQEEDDERRRNIAVNQYDTEIDQIEDYTQNYNFNESVIEEIVNENIQRVYDETHDQSLPELSEIVDPVILQAEDQKIKTEADSSKTYQGPTNIYFSLENRKVVFLAVPVYKCQGRGTITMEIIVNQRGWVNSTKKISGDAAGNECLVIAAKAAALKTRFNPNVNAPLRQAGTITYNFIAQ